MKLFWIVLLVMLLTACTTTNIYFPVQAVENAADKIIGDVWQQADKAPADKAQADKHVAAKPAEKGVVPKKEKK